MIPRYDVAVAGLQVLDLLVTDVDSALFSNESTTVGGITLALGGDAVNQAISLSQLGDRTALLGAVGQDKLGDTLVALLGGYPIGVYDARLDVQTSISIVMIDKEKERHFLRHPGNNDALRFEHLNQEVLKNSGIVSLASAMALTSMDGEGVLKLLTLAHEAGARTAMDFRVNRGGYDMDLTRASFALTDYVLPNVNEAAFLTGEKEPEQMARALYDMGAKHVVLKLGENGCILLDGDGMRTLPALKANVVDTTGAGDNFAAAFLHGVARHWDTDTCARFASAAGAIAVEHLGASGFLGSEANVRARMEIA